VLNAMAKALHLYSAKSGAKAKGSLQVLAVDSKGKVIKIDRVTRATVDATREMARLVDTPPTELNPEAMVREARKLLKGVPGVRTSVIVGPDLLKKKLEGIHAVGRTAVKAPRMFLATFTPAKASKKHIALVGKGITYDTGGLSIKGKTGMTTMKCDMGGSAATLGAFKILATTGCKHKLSLVLCLAENAVGPTSYKPDDILTMHSGKTVEINNTFYRLPRASVLETWAGQVPADFQFVLKASRRITHFKRLKDAGDVLTYVLQTATVLGHKLGPMLFQLPPNLPKDTARLVDFLTQLPPKWPAAFEFRHKSWFDDEIYDALRERGAALVVTDSDDESQPIVSTASYGYLRLRREEYDDDSLRDWARRIGEQPWERAHVFFKHEVDGAGPRAAARLIELLA